MRNATMNRSLVSLLCLVALVGLAVASSACGRPFDVKTAPGMVELDNQEPQYEYRALTPEGVVMAVRVVDTDDKGDLEFWTRATLLRVRQLDGYALLGARDVKSRDGTPGRELRFGHDENGKPYLYTMRMYVAQGRLFVVEAGGPRDLVQRYQPSLDWMESSVRVKCGCFLAPVLASHTCNRW
jgi:hypothetical protein